MSPSNLILCLTEWNFIQLHILEWVAAGRFTLYASFLCCQSSQEVVHKCKRERCAAKVIRGVQARANVSHLNLPCGSENYSFSVHVYFVITIISSSYSVLFQFVSNHKP